MLWRTIHHFFMGYCQLALAHVLLYFYGFDHTSARLALAEAASQQPLAFVRTQVKRTWGVRGIFIGISITMVLWLNWALPVRACLTIRKYSS